MCFISNAVVPYRYIECCTEVILGSLMVGNFLVSSFATFVK